MAIKGLDNIIKQRQQQFGNIIGDKVSDNSLEILEEIKEAIGVLASNQQKLYEKLEIIEENLKK